MLKDFGLIKRLSDEVGNAANTAAAAVLDDFSDLQGREEEVTAQLRGEINRNLLSQVAQRLDGKAINGCRIQVATFKKQQESDTGADLAGVIDLEAGGRRVSKAFLAQAKVGKNYVGARGAIFIRGYNKDIPRQAEAMLRQSSDSFFFVYSKQGIHCVPALQVYLDGSKTIDTGRHPFRSFGSFFEEFVKCFVGDHRISPESLKAKSLEDYVEKLSVNAALSLSVELKKS